MKNYIQKLDNQFNRLIENERVVSTFKRMKPHHWFIFGAISLFLLQLFINFTMIVTEFLSFLLSVITIWIGKLFGLSDSQTFGLIETIYSNETIIENPYEFNNLAVYTTDYVAAFLTWIGYVGRTGYNLVLEYFPVLTELNFEFNWINIDISKILRSVFSIIQFVLIFFLSIKIKRYLKRKMKRDNDYFDKKYFEITCV